MSKTSSPDATLHSGLSGKLFGAFDSGVDARRKHYEAHPDQAPTAAAIDSIISSCANTNALIAGGFSLIPGPWGLIALIPEMVMVVQNQVKMICDIGVASGKKDVLTRELVLSVALSASGTSAMTVLTMRGSTLLVRRTSLRVFQRLVRALAGRVTQQMLRSAVAKWLPFIGAVAIAVWTRYTTMEIGRKAKEMFAGDIEIEPQDGEDAGEGDEAAGAVETNRASKAKAATAGTDDMAVTKLLVLDDLMRCDGQATPTEQGYIAELMSRSGLSAAGRTALVRRMDEPSPRRVDLGPFLADRDEAIALLMDMAALVLRDGQVKASERAFVLKVGSEIGLSPLQVAAALG